MFDLSARQELKFSAALLLFENSWIIDLAGLAAIGVVSAMRALSERVQANSA